MILPEGRELHNRSMFAYWEDAEFHARCYVLFKALKITDNEAQVQLIYTLYLDDIVRRDYLQPVSVSRCSHVDLVRGQCWIENAPHDRHVYTGDEFG